MQTINIQTWRCENCGYAQDFAPTQEAMDQHFNRDKNYQYADVAADTCPNCRLQELKGKPLSKVTDPAKKIKVTILDAQDVELMEVPDENDGKKTRKLTKAEKDQRIKEINGAIAHYRQFQD